MPVYNPDRLEFAIDSGYITIVTDDGQRVPAYWAHPRAGNRFAAIGLFHDWWGVNNMCRMLANFFAQSGYYVIVPDLFGGRVASTPKEAMQLLAATHHTRFRTADAALTVLEHHNRTTGSVAAVGLGMGGTLAFEAAINRDDLEAAVACAGFPQAYLGQFARANTPILALYGSEEPYTRPVVLKALRNELAATPLREKHRIEIIAGAGHEFFTEMPTPEQREQGKQILAHILSFLEKNLEHTFSSSGSLY